MNSTTPENEFSHPAAYATESAVVSRAVVAAVANAENVSPVELTPPLYDAVDPDALEQFVASVDAGPDESDVRVTFPYVGYEVTVTGDGDVSLEPE